MSGLALALVLAGCGEPGAPVPGAAAPAETRVDVLATDTMRFVMHTIAPAVGLARDLGEPTIEASDRGVLYVAAHVPAVLTTGTPAYVSRDDGRTWEPLPMAARVRGQGAAPPPGDEGYIVADDAGRAWMVDIALATYPVAGWCDDGREACYFNPNAYDRGAAAQNACRSTSLNDRPWAATAAGKLLMVNNPGGGPLQIGVLDLPPAASVALSAKWNLCASSGGFVPGVPGIHVNGTFVVPQPASPPWVDGPLRVILGDVKDILHVREATVVEHYTNADGGGAEGGVVAALDRRGNLFVGAMNNTHGGATVARLPTQPRPAAADGQFIIAASGDQGSTFVARTFRVGAPVRFFNVDGNRWGEGALVTWSIRGSAANVDRWYAAHVHVGADGAPILENVSFAGQTVGAVGDIIGSALGPDGRAYLAAMHLGDAIATTGQTPLRVLVQEPGTPTLAIDPGAVPRRPN